MPTEGSTEEKNSLMTTNLIMKMTTDYHVFVEHRIVKSGWTKKKAIKYQIVRIQWTKDPIKYQNVLYHSKQKNQLKFVVKWTLKALY